LDQLDKEIEEIRKSMLEATKKETNNRERWNRGEPATLGKQQHQQHRKGVGGQIQNEF
jgi:hypothetical protein